MQTLINLQQDYNLSAYNHQFKLPLELEVLILDNNPVRLLSAFVEDMELTDLYQTYGKTKKDQVSPRQMFKIESAANRHTFVWKKSVTKHMERLGRRSLFLWKKWNWITVSAVFLTVKSSGKEP